MKLLPFILLLVFAVPLLDAQIVIVEGTDVAEFQGSVTGAPTDLNPLLTVSTQIAGALDRDGGDTRDTFTFTITPELAGSSIGLIEYTNSLGGGSQIQLFAGADPIFEGGVFRPALSTLTVDASDVSAPGGGVGLDGDWSKLSAGDYTIAWAEFTSGESVSYTLEIVPEPSAYALLVGLAALVFAYARRRR